MQGRQSPCFAWVRPQWKTMPPIHARLSSRRKSPPGYLPRLSLATSHSAPLTISVCLANSLASVRSMPRRARLGDLHERARCAEPVQEVQVVYREPFPPADGFERTTANHDRAGTDINDSFLGEVVVVLDIADALRSWAWLGKYPLKPMHGSHHQHRRLCLGDVCGTYRLPRAGMHHHRRDTPSSRQSRLLHLRCEPRMHRGSDPKGQGEPDLGIR